MFRAIIAEDELLIRVGLDATIPWGELGMKLEASVGDGQKAWEAYQRISPDVVITDIRMPGLSGLELARRIRQCDSRCRIVIITCIEDFNTLRDFIGLDISGYLLKASMTNEEICEALGKVREELEHSRPGYENEPPASAAEQYARLLEAYAIDRHLTRDEFRQRCAALPDMGVHALLLAGTSANFQRPLPGNTLRNILDDRFRSLGAVVVGRGDHAVVFALSPPQEGKATLSAAVDGAANYLHRAFGIRLRAVAAWPEPKAEHLPELVSACRAGVDAPFFYPDGLYFLDEQGEPHNTRARELLARLEDNPMAVCHAGWRDSWRFPMVLEKMRTAWGRDADGFIACCNTVAALFKQPPPAATNDAAAMLEALAAAMPPPQPVSTYGEAIMQSVRHLGKDLRQAPPLSEIANRTNISQNYYSILFKQMFGINYSEYITRLRLQCACRLLTAAELSLQGVSEHSGFGDITYFIRVFKKRMGLPPRQWRMRQ